jgi:membrane protein DedA with SNARE-associated domain
MALRFGENSTLLVIRLILGQTCLACISPLGELTIIRFYSILVAKEAAPLSVVVVVAVYLGCWSCYHCCGFGCLPNDCCVEFG